MGKEEENKNTSKKSFKILKSIPPYIVSVFALIISFLALNEAKLANRLEIEPVISINCPESFKGHEFEIIFKNEGNVGVKDLTIAYVFRRSEPTEKDLMVSVMSPTYKMPEQIKMNEERSLPIDLEGDIEYSKTEIVKTSDGRDVHVEIGQGGILGIKILYRRVSDSKLFEDTSYFFLMPKTSEIIVTELKGWFAGGFLDTIKSIEKSFPF